MPNTQRVNNPDVNSIDVDEEPVSQEGYVPPHGNENDDSERPNEEQPIPLPPDREPAHPIEEPPGRDGPPVGDVDDSPKIIADE